MLLVSSETKPSPQVKKSVKQRERRGGEREKAIAERERGSERGPGQCWSLARENYGVFHLSHGARGPRGGKRPQPKRGNSEARREGPKPGKPTGENRFGPGRPVEKNSARSLKNKTV